MEKYEQKLRQMQVFYEEYSMLVVANMDLALNLDRMIGTVGKPLAEKLIDGLVSHIRKDLKNINKYSNNYVFKPLELPEIPKTDVCTQTEESKKLCAVATDTSLTKAEGLTPTAPDPPQ